MIFRRSYTLKSALSTNEIKQKLNGKHLDVHKLDFEVMEREGILKIIPHTEYQDEKVYTLPITHIKLDENTGGGTTVKLKFKPRRIDIGGPTIALIFILLIGGMGTGLYLTGKTQYATPSMALMVTAGILLVIFAFRMNAGYFDYLRKIRSWVKSKI